jgi:hypothetical protein
LIGKKGTASVNPQPKAYHLSLATNSDRQITERNPFPHRITSFDTLRETPPVPLQSANSVLHILLSIMPALFLQLRQQGSVIILRDTDSTMVLQLPKEHWMDISIAGLDSGKFVTCLSTISSG